MESLNNIENRKVDHINICVNENVCYSNENAFDYYDKPIEGIDLLKTTCIGGSTLVSAGNGVRSLEKNFKEIGIDLILKNSLWGLRFVIKWFGVYGLRFTVRDAGGEIIFQWK
mgnify:CR=1 FL=1